MLVIGRAADPYGNLLDSYLAPATDITSASADESNWTAAQWRQYDLETALKLEGQKLTQELPAAPLPPPITIRTGLLLAGVLLFALPLGLRPLANLLNKHFNPWTASAATLAKFLTKVRVEEASFSEFVRTFQLGPGAAAGEPALLGDSTGEDEAAVRFLIESPPMLTRLRTSLARISAAENAPARRTKLIDLHRELGRLKGSSGLPKLLPIWQVAMALEGLLQQLTQANANVTPSTLRTVAAGFDLLLDLCTPELQADLLSNPPIRMLAVDDDLISRKAVSLALKKALSQPDLAENGEVALAMATEHAYDVIFLDVQMPGMDGFELCTRIHDTVPNAWTPVVFVTCQSDFEGRAHAALCGGTDLLAKPFLTFEITVKALTLALQARLRSRRNLPTPQGAERKLHTVSSNRPPGILKASRSFWRFHDVAYAAADSDWVDSRTRDSSRTADRRWYQFTSKPDSPETPAPRELSPPQLLEAFLKRASANLESLRDLVQTAFRLTDEPERHAMLADFYLRFSALIPQGLPAEMHPVLQMTVALEGLLTKLVGNTNNCTSSSLMTVASAVDLLIELCDENVRPDLAANPPARLLVVDDDPVVRRAITGALQMSFDKPESVEDGNTALTLANQKTFDAIFMDVEMPGQDGFEVCLRIRKTALNRNTPVVFVTCHSDFKSRSQSAICGGNDLMAKPFLPAEIKVKALTFILMGRLRKGRSRKSPGPLPEPREAMEREMATAPA